MSVNICRHDFANISKDGSIQSLCKNMHETQFWLKNQK
jgi:hypothetical protein